MNVSTDPSPQVDTSICCEENRDAMTFPVWFEKVQEKETVRLESATTWVSTAPNCAPYVFATFFNQNKIVCLQLKLSLYLFLSL